RSIVLLVISSTLVSQTTLPLAYEDSEAYRVYAAILPAEWAVRSAKAKTLIIQSETTAWFSMCLRPEKEWEEIVGPAIADYSAQNSHAWRLQPMFSIDLPYRLIAADEIRGIFAGPLNWDGFYSRYPDSGGYIELSAVGFNPDKTVAVVYT